MSQDLTHMGGAVPAHIQRLFQAQAGNADLSAGVSAGYKIVSYKGKVWAVVEGGDRTIITRGGTGRDANEPAGSLVAVILRANPNLNKVYYPSGYEEGSTEKPTCHSDDGIRPAADAQEKQAEMCAACPHNQWGSKVTETSNKGKACSDTRRLAIAPADDMEDAMLLRVPPASLKTLLAYGQQLERRGVPYQALVTRIGFEPTAAYPSLTFLPERWLSEEELAKAQEMFESDLVLNITAVKPVTEALEAPAAPASMEAAFAALDGGTGPASQTPPPAKPKKAKAQATPAEVQAAVEVAPKKGTGFGGGGTVTATVASVQVVQPAVNQQLAEAAMSELDSVLAGFDDEAEGDED